MFANRASRGVQLPQSEPDSSGRLCRLAEKGRVAELREALAEAPDGLVDRRDANGFSALLHACAEGHAEVVRLLLEHGASTTVTDRKGRTPAEDTKSAEIRETILAERARRMALSGIVACRPSTASSTHDDDASHAR